MRKMIIGLAVALTVATTGCAVDTEPSADVLPDEADSPAQAEPSPEPTAEVPTAEADESEPEAEPELEPVDPIEYSGAGDTILGIEKPDANGIGIAVITHTGSSNFAVRTAETSKLLINEIGSYTGRVLFDVLEGEHSERLEITADGSWSVTVEPLASVPRFDASIDGLGDDVIVYIGDGGVATIEHSGESNFAVWSYGSRRDLLVNEIGSYAGEKLLDTSILEITADGEWSIDVRD